MCCNNFREGNIVLWAEVTMDIEKVERRHLEALFQTTDGVLVDRDHDAMKKRSVVYFLLASSYGAEMVAVCRSVESISIDSSR